MRLYYLSASVIPSLTANSVQVMRMCEAFAELGNEVVLFAEKGKESNPYEYYGVTPAFELVTCPAATQLFTARRGLVRAFQAELWKRPAPDVYYGRNAFALLMAAASGVPVVYEAHLLPGGVQLRTESRLFRTPHFRRLVTVSDALAKDYQDTYPETRGARITVAGSAACPSVVRESTPLPTLAISNGRINVGYIGSLSAGRGVPHLIALAQRLPELGFHIVGGTRMDIDRWRTILTVPGNVCFHGSLYHAAVAGAMSQFDILVAPYEKRIFTAGGFECGRWASPMKLFEYMSSGRAVIASDLPVIRAAVADEVHVLLAKPESVSCWETQLRRLAADATLRARLGANAKCLLLERFTWRQRAERILQEVLSDLEAVGTSVLQPAMRGNS